jgi:hypothetical protein
LPKTIPSDLSKNYCITPNKCAKINKWGWKVQVYKNKIYYDFATDQDTPSNTYFVGSPHFTIDD